MASGRNRREFCAGCSRRGWLEASEVKVRKATAKYEAWLGRYLTLLPADLKLKHEAMRAAKFPFLRATYYRWAQIFPKVCSKLDAAVEVLGVGDLHVENFGTWRDVEGRLVW